MGRKGYKPEEIDPEILPLVELLNELEHIETAVSSRVDPKSDLQELLARTGRRVMYTELSAEGPAHERRFTCAAVVDGECAAVQAGCGSRRRRTGCFERGDCPRRDTNEHE